MAHSPTVGRPRKPEAIRKLQGVPGHSRPLNKKEPKFTVLSEVPPCPEELGPIGQRTWAKYAPLLVGVGVLTEADVHVLVTFCDAWQTWCECQADVQVNGSVLESEGKLIRNPAGVAKDAAWKTVRECSALLGLDPSSRSRLVVDGPKEENPFAALGGGKA